MLLKLSHVFYVWARGRLILAVVAAFVVLINLPLADPALLAESPDGKFAYTPEQAFSAVDSYGADGRAQMIRIHLADFLLVALYTTMFCLLLSWLFRRGFAPGSGMRTFNLVPLLGGFFDAMENIWIMILILAYPARPAAAAWLATVSTTGKYLMGILIILLLGIGLAGAARNGFKDRGAAAAGNGC